jgi:hypothetical protein
MIAVMMMGFIAAVNCQDNGTVTTQSLNMTGSGGGDLTGKNITDLTNNTNVVPIAFKTSDLVNKYNLTLLPNVTKVPKTVNFGELTTLYNVTDKINSTDLRTIFNLTSVPDVLTLENLTGITNATELASMFNITGLTNTTDPSTPVDQIPSPPPSASPSPDPNAPPTNGAQDKTITVGIVMTIMTMAVAMV